MRFARLFFFASLLALATPAPASHHNGDGRTPAYAKPDAGQVKRVEQARSPRKEEPKPKPKPQKESGEKGGTEDMNIGIGELQE